MRIVYTRAALEDLTDAYLRATEHGLERARQRVEGLRAAVRNLLRHPEMGKKGRVLETRELVVSPFVIVYRVQGEQIEIIRVWHGREVKQAPR